MTSKASIKTTGKLPNEMNVYGTYILISTCTWCLIFFNYEHNDVCHCLTTYSTLLYCVTMSQLFMRTILVWFTQFGLNWFGMNLDSWALKTHTFVNMRQSISHQMLNFPRLEVTSKTFSADAISSIDISLNIGLTLDLDTFQLSWMLLDENGLLYDHI